MGWVLGSASLASAPLLSCWKSSQTSYSGESTSTTRQAIQLANASFSHRSSHQRMVTRLPDIGQVGANVHVFAAPSAASATPSSGPLASTVTSADVVTCQVKWALNSGSSKQGKMARA